MLEGDGQIVNAEHSKVDGLTPRELRRLTGALLAQTAQQAQAPSPVLQGQFNYSFGVLGSGLGGLRRWMRALLEKDTSSGALA